MTTNHKNTISRWESRRKDAARDEVGAALILALVFLVAVSGMVLALAGSTSNNLLNSVHFTATRTVDNAASNAIEVAVQSIRYTPTLETSGIAQTLNASPPSYCWGSGPSSSFQSPNSTTTVIDAWCSTAWTPSSTNSRVVTLSACPTFVTTDAATCALHPLLQEVVTFDDYPAGVSAPNSGQCAVYCGTGITVDSLLWSPSVPAVTGAGVNPPSGSITGQTAVTITGSGFVPNATTVNFVDTNPIDNVIIPATNVSVTSATTLTATSPAITTTGTAYYVAVTTPGGTSAHTPASNFSYAPAKPTVTNLSPNTGQVQHGTSVTITGSGFVNGTNGTPPVVTFIGGGGSFTATAVSVVGSTTITAISPTTAPAGTYVVTVTTTNGTSASGPVFTNS
jgi:IPT/TIG domain-containing protein